MSLEYDKGILSFGTVALGLSWAFLKDSALNLALIDKIVLCTSWSLFVLSIFSVIISFILSRKAEEKEINNSYDYYIVGDQEAFERENVYNAWNSRFGIGAGLLFSFAVLLTIWSGIAVLFHPKSEPDQLKAAANGERSQKSMNDIVQKGMPTAPRMPVQTSTPASSTTQGTATTSPVPASASNNSSGQK